MQSRAGGSEERNACMGNLPLFVRDRKILSENGSVLVGLVSRLCVIVLRNGVEIGQFSPQLLQALRRGFAPGGTTEIIIGIEDKFPTMRALAAKVVFEELHRLCTIATLDFVNVFGSPVTRILARALRHAQIRFNWLAVLNSRN